MPPVVQVNTLSKSFTRRVRDNGFRGLLNSYLRPQHETIDAVRNLQLAMDAGDSLALIGPNGAGKSTTIKMLTA